MNIFLRTFMQQRFSKKNVQNFCSGAKIEKKNHKETLNLDCNLLSCEEKSKKIKSRRTFTTYKLLQPRTMDTQ